MGKKHFSDSTDSEGDNKSDGSSSSKDSVIVQWEEYANKIERKVKEQAEEIKRLKREKNELLDDVEAQEKTIEDLKKEISHLRSSSAKSKSVKSKSSKQSKRSKEEKKGESESDGFETPDDKNGAREDLVTVFRTLNSTILKEKLKKKSPSEIVMKHKKKRRLLDLFFRVEDRESDSILSESIESCDNLEDHKGF